MSFYRPLRHRGNLATFTDGKTIERDTLTCGHCNKIMVIEYMQLADNITYGGLCRGCEQHICATCYAVPKCNHIERWCDEIEKRDIMRRSYEMAMNW
jgi:hypothetical protein